MRRKFVFQVPGIFYFATSLLRYFAIFILVLCFIFLPHAAGAQNSTYDLQVGTYIRAYSTIAVEEMNQFHIPASITLAQGIIESAAGQSLLAKEANNHFGIKCHNDWAGPTYHRDDEQANECFRKYSHAEESFHDHSFFLAQRERYKGLFKLSITDYRGWAEGLENAGYATNKQYAGMLIRTIEQYQLYFYDNQEYVAQNSPGNGSDSERYEWISTFSVSGYAGDGRKIYNNNGLRCIVAHRSDNLLNLSQMLEIPVKKLIKYNDLKNAGSLEPGQVVYMEMKKRKAVARIHIVKAGESLYEISQRYGIKMKLLLKRSGMSEKMDPFPGQSLPLK